jgi:hypothetical protein
MDKFTPRFWFITLMVFIAAFVRLLPHPPNFAPIAAMALFGGAYFNKKTFAFIVPLTALFISDAIIGFYSYAFPVYLSFALIVVIGILLLKQVNFKNLILASVSASVSFFLITNFAVWALGTLYPKSFAGLMMSYTAAIPFFHHTILGDLFFSGVMFGVYELIKHKAPALQKVEL